MGGGLSLGLDIWTIGLKDVREDHYYFLYEEDGKRSIRVLGQGWWKKSNRRIKLIEMRKGK